jgi:hypothetical protein
MMTMVFDRFPFGGNERLLALALADNADDYGEHIYPGNATLARKCVISERTVVRLIDKLIDIGWLIKVGQGNKRLGQANEYKINTKWILGDNLSLNLSNNQVTNTATLSDKTDHDQVTNTQLLGDTAMSPQRHIQHHNNVITTPRAKETNSEKPNMKLEGELACRLIPLGVSVTSMHPTLIKWVQDKIPLELIMQCLQIARLQKPHPEKIAANYLDRIIRSELKPKKPDKSWLMDDDATIAHGQEIGLPPKIGESMRDYKTRLQAA